MNTKKLISYISRISIFGGLAIILYMVPGLQFPIIPGLNFLKLHFDEIPALIASFAYGPLTGSLIIIFKGLFKLIQDIGETGGIGVLADIIYGLALIIPCGLIYKKRHDFKGALLALGIGILINLIVSSFLGYYLIYPLYGKFFNPDAKTYYEMLESILPLFKVVNNSLESPFDIRISLYFLLPFNLIKCLIVGGATIVVYKPIKNLINKYQTK